jgi:hypothetical protein
MRDYDKTIISQFSNATKLCALISNFNDYIDPDADLEAFYNCIWNIDTAQGAGLDVWGRIVGVNRVLTITNNDYFGFEEGGWSGFGQAAFYTGTLQTDNFTLTDEAYRSLIFAKAAANITDCSIPAINQILMNLFPNRGNAYVTEGPFFKQTAWFGFEESTDALGFGQAPFGEGRQSFPSGMTMTYVFEFALEPFEVAIVTTSGVLPKPTGVLATASYQTA